MSAVVDIERSPVNRHRWRLSLSCGCVVWLTRPKRPTRESHPCSRHSLMPQ